MVRGLYTNIYSKQAAMACDCLVSLTGKRGGGGASARGAWRSVPCAEPCMSCIAFRLISCLIDRSSRRAFGDVVCPTQVAKWLKKKVPTMYAMTSRLNISSQTDTQQPQFLGLLHLGWDVSVFVFKPIGLAIGNAIYYIAFGVVIVLRLLWRPLEFLLLPVLYLGDFIVRCTLAPFRFLAKFEVGEDDSVPAINRACTLTR